MKLVLLKSKIHRATVTEKNLDYEGSLTVDRDLMDAVGIIPHEQVQVYNIANGQRFETYAIEGRRGSGMICVNGAAAHLAEVGHQIIIVTYAIFGEDEAKAFHPRVAMVDQANRIVRVS